MKFKFLVILFTSLTLLLSISLAAQTEKGTVSLGLQLENIRWNRSLSSSLSLTGEYFIKDGWSIGGSIGNFSYKKTDKSKYFHLEAYANTRKYFRNGKKFQPYIGANVGFLYYNYENQMFDDIGPSKFLSLGIDAGFQYNINKKLSLTMGVQASQKFSLNENRANHRTDIKATLGLKYNFGPRRKKNVAKKIY